MANVLPATPINELELFFSGIPDHGPCVYRRVHVRPFDTSLIIQTLRLAENVSSVEYVLVGN